MISLSNIDAWSELNHAYGEASDIPELLKMLATYPISETYETEPYFSLWSSLCHQGDVYSSSYAALPHIVNYIESNPERVTSDFFQLPLQIEICRSKEQGPKLSGDLKAEYFTALNKLFHLVTKVTTNTNINTQLLSATVAVTQGNHQLGELILELPSDLIPECNEWIEENA